MARDRQLTMARILGAAEGIIARDGVDAAGINAIADAAGVDKVLLYRYFGGRTQLLRALGRDRRLWPDIALPPAPADGAAAATLAGDLTVMLLAVARDLRAQPLARRAALWQLAERDEFARDAAAARETHARAIAAALRGRHRLPPFVDLQAVIAVLLAAAVQLALQSGAGGAFAGLKLHDGADWARAERALARTIQALLGASDG
jgi:AcrR family transcriptional regulator